ncbi:MAG: hypothetical protein Q9195_005259 [Heterodermia aff. obscurata]
MDPGGEFYGGMACAMLSQSIRSLQHNNGMIRLGYFAALDSLNGIHSGLPAEKPKGSQDEHAAHRDAPHMKHCFDYLRQAILCAGDTTIEWARESGGGENDGQVDDWGIEHQCRSSKTIFDFTANNRAENDADGIANVLD